MAANIFLWVWDYKFMYTAGLNSASAEFSKYYMTLFWGELLVLGVFTGVWYGVMVRKGRKVVTEPIPESRRNPAADGLVEPRRCDQPLDLHRGELLAELGRGVAPDDGA